MSSSRLLRSSSFALVLGATVLAVPAVAHADTSPEATPGHGPAASGDRFPSHRFQLAARAPRAQLAFHYGLTQPLFLHGFNAAADLRLRRWVFSYSHGQGLEYSRVPGLRTAAEERAGLRVVAPFSTGLGVGFTLLDELYVMADFKVHRFELSADAGRAHYTTVTVGAEIGWRFFLWKGLYAAPVVRFWPNVADTAPSGGVRVPTRSGTDLVHKPVSQGVNGVFANVLVGWAFDL